MQLAEGPRFTPSVTGMRTAPALAPLLQEALQQRDQVIAEVSAEIDKYVKAHYHIECRCQTAAGLFDTIYVIMNTNKHAHRFLTADVLSMSEREAMRAAQSEEQLVSARACWCICACACMCVFARVNMC